MLLPAYFFLYTDHNINFYMKITKFVPNGNETLVYIKICSGLPYKHTAVLDFLQDDIIK